MYILNSKEYQRKPFIINTGDQRLVINLDSVPNIIIRQVNFSIKAYPRPNRETQQIYINGRYYMSFPSRVVNGQDPNNILGSQAIELITYLYERGYNLKTIKNELDNIINKQIKRRLVNPELILKQRERQLNKLNNMYSQVMRY